LTNFFLCSVAFLKIIFFFCLLCFAFALPCLLTRDHRVFRVSEMFSLVIFALLVFAAAAAGFTSEALARAKQKNLP